ncbi:hypothetical protein Dvina_10160 [Dactylosporangium vinaceum]|uniref:Fibronectin type III domain-containing protein n=1 Tax=Dactylosporangium vinaceum TaxID=53362 RepID=A0ABV5MBE0_9ACTN|nr:fibronectin type III domain-containing protein [Dactylosporangium vinaceum]UAB98414.1 hypothetical protein Dvina_10160 [Dactylosporangium vinaceum]
MKRRIGAGLVLLSALVTGVAGCSMLPGLSGATPGGTGGETKRDGKVVNLPEKTVYSRGDAVDPNASNTTGAPVRGPIASLSPFPSRTQTRPTPSFSPTDCMGVYRQGVVNGADVTPAATSAVVSWWNIGDPSLVEYRLAAVPQRLYQGPQPAWVWQTVARGAGCSRVSATVTGLTSGDPYVFVVHAVLKKYETLPPIIPEVARSSATVML